MKLSVILLLMSSLYTKRLSDLGLSVEHVVYKLRNCCWRHSSGVKTILALWSGASCKDAV